MFHKGQLLNHNRLDLNSFAIGAQMAPQWVIRWCSSWYILDCLSGTRVADGSPNIRGVYRHSAISITSKSKKRPARFLSYSRASEQLKWFDDWLSLSVAGCGSAVLYQWPAHFLRAHTMRGLVCAQHLSHCVTINLARIGEEQRSTESNGTMTCTDTVDTARHPSSDYPIWWSFFSLFLLYLGHRPPLIVWQ